MKKLAITLFSGAFLIVPLLALADHDIAHTIQQLQAQIQALQNQIKNIQQEPTKSTTPPKPAVVIAERPENIPSFKRDLSFGMKNNSEVTDLQELLTDQGYYAGPVSGNFGLLTLSAVKKFQSANGINPTGYFGPRSRAIATQIIQKLVGEICPREEGCEGNVLPVEKLTITTKSDLRGVVNEYFSAVFDIFGGSGNYNLSRMDGYIPGLTFTSKGGEHGPLLYGNPTKSGVYDIVIFVKDDYGAYGKERFTIVISDKTQVGKPPVISGIKGPTTLKVGEEGIWTVEASAPNSSSLNYKVIWGDEVYGLEAKSELAPRAIPFKQTATFSHIYYRVGVYNPVFYIVNDRGLEAKTSISVNVGEAATKTLISEQVKCVFGGASSEQKCYTAGGSYDTYGCSGTGTCVTEVIGNKGNQVTWKSSCGGYAYTTMDGVNESAEFKCVPTIQQSFSASVTNGKFSGTAPFKVDFNIGLYNYPSCGVTYLWNFGDGITSGSKEACAGDPTTLPSRAVYFTHTYNQPGTYNISVTVNNVNNSVGTITVTSATPTQPSVQVLSPNGGETWQVGSTQTIKWATNNIKSQTGLLDIIRLRNSSGQEITLLTNTPNDGIEQIVVPSLPAGSYTLEIKTYSDTLGYAAMDKSDAPFSIAAIGTAKTTIDFAVGDMYLSQLSPQPNQDFTAYVTVSADPAKIPQESSITARLNIYDSYGTRVYSVGTGVDKNSLLSTGKATVKFYTGMFSPEVKLAILRFPAGTYKFVADVIDGNNNDPIPGNDSRTLTVTIGAITAPPSYYVEPSGPLVRGQSYNFYSKVSGNSPNSRVVLYLQRPNGTMKYDDNNDILIKTNNYTDSNGSWSASAYQTLTIDGQIGTWTSWVTVGGVKSNSIYHNVVE